LYSIYSDGSNLIKLNNDDASINCTDFAIFPDGKKIAYASEERYNVSSGSNPTHTEIHRYINIMNFDGSGKITIDNVVESDRYEGISLSPQGNQIVYSISYNVYVINIDGSNKIKIGAGSYPQWSPDSEKIIYTNGLLYIINPDGTSLQSIDPFNKSNYVVSYQWSPDGKKIVFCNPHDYNIYIMNSDGSSLTKLATGFYPQWSST